MTRVGMVMQKGMPFADWQQLIRSLKEVGTSIQLIIGDAIAYGANEYGSKYTKALELLCDDELDRKSWYDTLRNWASVCSNVSMSLRGDFPLFYSHFREISSMVPSEQRRWAKLAYDNQWSVADLREAIRRGTGRPTNRLDGGFQIASWVSDGIRWLHAEADAITSDPERRSLIKKNLEPVVAFYNRL